jgi:hypothetical protein
MRCTLQLKIAKGNLSLLKNRLSQSAFVHSASLPHSLNCCLKFGVYYSCAIDPALDLQEMTTHRMRQDCSLICLLCTRSSIITLHVYSIISKIASAICNLYCSDVALASSCGLTMTAASKSIDGASVFLSTTRSSKR